VGDPRGDLSGARAEALTLADLFGAAPLIGERATKQRVLDALDDPAGHTDLIHFACHGHLDWEDAWNSRLTLANGTLTAEDYWAAFVLVGDWG
jgi:CHAT domain-containing protein